MCVNILCVIYVSMCIVSMLYCVITTNVIMDKNIFCVGLLYTYLAGHVGRKGAFRALT